MCERALVPRNEHGPAFLRGLDGFGGCLLKEQGHTEKHCVISSQQCHLEGETGGVPRDSWEWRDGGHRKPCGHRRPQDLSIFHVFLPQITNIDREH